RPQDQRDRRRAKLDRVRVPARVDLHLSAAMAADLDAIAPLRAWLREWQARVRAVDFEGGRTMCASEIVAFGTVAPMVEGIDAVMDAQWHKVWGNIRDFTVHADQARGAIAGDHGWAATTRDLRGTRPDGPTINRPRPLTDHIDRHDGPELPAHSPIPLFHR